MVYPIFTIDSIENRCKSDIKAFEGIYSFTDDTNLKLEAVKGLFDKKQKLFREIRLIRG
jgi:hypothetical protein